MINFKEMFQTKLFKVIIVICLFLGLSLSVKPIKKIIDNKNGLTKDQYTILTKGKNISTIQVKGNIESLDDKMCVYADSINQQLKVSKVNYKIGDRVKTGDILAVLDSSELQKNIENSKEKLKTSKANTANNLKIKQDAYENIKYKYENNLIEEIIECNKNLSAAQIDLNEKSRNFNQNKSLNESEAVSNEQLAQSEAAFNNAKNIYDSAVSALETAKKDVETALNSAQSEYETAKIANDDRSEEISLEIQEEQLRNCDIKATIDGTITDVNAKVGTPCGTNQLFEIQNIDNLIVKADVEENDITKINIGNQVKITTDSLGNDQIDGVVYSIYPIAEKKESNLLSLDDDNSEDSAKFETKINIESTDERLMIGMKATLNIILEQNDDVYKVPCSCIVTEGDDKYIYIAESKNGQYVVNKIPINTGTQSDTFAEITSKDILDNLIVLNSPSDYNVGNVINLKN
ncbi:HlyD family secretion protein [Clostridium butyricum]